MAWFAARNTLLSAAAAVEAGAAPEGAEVVEPAAAPATADGVEVDAGA